MRCSDLFELADKPYNWTVEHDLSTIYQFVTKENLHYSVCFETYNDYVEFTFSQDSEDDFHFGITNSGDSFRILATVQRICNDFLKDNKPAAVELSAAQNEPSRIRLYDRCLSRWFIGYQISDTHMGGGAKHYRLVKS